MTEYKKIIMALRIMDEKQLLELFHDMGDIKAIQRIADCAFEFVENYEYPEEGGTPEWVDWKDQDDAQRYRDIKSTQDSWK